MPVSPICRVSYGVNPFAPTTGGVDADPNSAISIKLEDTLGVVNWFLQVLGTDELSTNPTLTGVNPTTHQVATKDTIVTFTYPNATGRGMLFQSTVTGAGGPVVTTFTIYTRTLGNKRVGTVGEKREGNTAFGWITLVNPLIRTGAGALYYNDAAASPATGSSTIQGALDFLKANSGGVTIQDNEVDIGGNPHQTINFFGANLTAIDDGGVARISVSPSTFVQNEGGDVHETPHQIVNFVGEGVSATNAGGGVVTVSIPGGGPSGDNADAVRSGPWRPFLGNAQVPLKKIFTTTLIDGATLQDGLAGADLVLAQRRLIVSGRIGGSLGQIYSIDLAGFQYGLDFSYLNVVETLSSPQALVGVGVPNNAFNVLGVASDAVVSTKHFESVHAATLVFGETSGEDWTGTRACHVYQDNMMSDHTTGAFFWTAPLTDTIYSNSVFDEGVEAALTLTAATPTGICSDGSNQLWISCPGIGQLRKYTTGDTVFDYNDLTEVAIVELSDVIELFFDGKYLWALATTGAHGTIHKLDQSGSLLGSYAFDIGTTASRSRMCSDGVSVWITLGRHVVRMASEGRLMVLLDYDLGADRTARGITADRVDGAVYVAVVNGASPVDIFAFNPDNGGLPEVRRRTAVWRIGDTSLASPFVAVSLPTLGLGIRSFEFRITASPVGGNAGMGFWHKSVTINDVLMDLVGAVSDVVAPKLDASAIADGYDVTIAIASSKLEVTITQGTFVGDTRWTIEVTEIRDFGGTL